MWAISKLWGKGSPGRLPVFVLNICVGLRRWECALSLSDIQSCLSWKVRSVRRHSRHVIYLMNHTSLWESHVNKSFSYTWKTKRQQWAEPQEGWKYIISLACGLHGQKPSCSGLYCTTTDWEKIKQNCKQHSMDWALCGPQTPADAHRRCHCCVTKPLNKLPASWLYVGDPDSTNKWFIFASLENGHTDVCDCFYFCGWRCGA